MVTLGPREGDALDHVGIERALGEEADVGELASASASKTSMKVAPMVLRLSSGSADAGELAEEQRAGVDVDQRDVEVAAEQVDHLLGLAEAEQAGVDEDAGELVADRPRGGGGR